MLYELLNITQTEEQTNALPSVALYFSIIAAIMILVYLLLSITIPFNVSKIDDHQYDLSIEAKNQTDIARATLEIEKQRLQIEIERLNLERAKQNLPPYIPISGNSETATTTSTNQNRPTV